MNLHFLFLLCSLIPSMTLATSFYIRPMSEFTQNAPNIVRGVIRSTRVEDQADSSGRRVIYTYADVEVKEVLKGPISGARIAVRKTGGEKNGMSLEIPGSPEFRENEETVLFLGEALSDQSYEVFDLELGKFALSRKDGHDYLKGGLLAYSDSAHDEAMGPGLKANHRDWSIEDLKSLIQKLGGTPRVSLASASPTPRPSPSSSPLEPTPPPLPSVVPESSPPSESVEAPTPSSISLVGGIAIGIGILLGLIFVFKRFLNRSG
jgi:hypothetical protein